MCYTVLDGPFQTKDYVHGKNINVNYKNTLIRKLAQYKTRALGE